MQNSGKPTRLHNTVSSTSLISASSINVEANSNTEMQTYQPGALRPLEVDHKDSITKRRFTFSFWTLVVACLVAAALIALVATVVYLATAGSVAGNTDTATVTSATPVTNKPNSDLGYRIPREMLATHYTIYILPNMSTSNSSDFSYHGRTTIHFVGVTPTKRIVLQATEGLIKVRQGSVRLYTDADWRRVSSPRCEMWSLNGRLNGIPMVGDVQYVPEYEFIVMQFDSTLVPNEKYVLQLAWDGPITSALQGFYHSSYVDTQGTRHYLAATHFSSINARRAFPCMDEPDIKATFDMRMLTYTDSPLKTLSNAQLSRRENDWYFRPRSSYCFARALTH